MVFPLSGFTAVPNPVMLSFMGAQSFIMMYMAGEAWQFGKRKISAMTNEEFNKIGPLDLLKAQQKTLKEAIPSMEKSMEDMTPMFRTITAEMIKAIPEIVKAIGEVTPDVAHDVGSEIGTQLTGVTHEQKHQSDFDTEREIKKAIAWLSTLGVMPSAEARLGPGISQGAIDYVAPPPPTPEPTPSTKFTQEQKDKQAANEKLMAARKLQAQIKTAVTTVQPTVQIPRGGIEKRKAGQSQIKGRNDIIKKISEASIEIKNYGRLALNASSSQRTNYLSRQQIWIASLRKWQQQLVNLLARYRF